MWQWQPIETAPKDQYVLIFQFNDQEPHWMDIARHSYVDEEPNRVWLDLDCDISAAAPSHWMPLPQPPK